MQNIELNGNSIIEEKESVILKFLYNTIIGRMILKIIVQPVISRGIGKILNTRLSNFMTQHYIKKYNIDLDIYETKKFKSFNDFFTRKIKRIEKSCNVSDFIATAESKVMYYEIDNELIVNVKKTKYSIEELIKDKNIYSEYKGGICLIYRLTPNNYHRYIFFDDGKVLDKKTINGKLHTVSPIVYDKYKVFTENTRVVNKLKTKEFGEIIQIEVGALCVGKIKNYENKEFKKYEEKGFFEFGGSTIIQIIKKDIVEIDERIIRNSSNNIETRVKIGEKIGKKVRAT